MMRLKFIGLLSVLVLIGCSASKPTKRSPFVLVAGKKIGSLELVENESGWSKKSRDSVQFDNQYLNKRPRIGFKYPGKTITFMKVYDGEKLIKQCDEGSYSRQEESSGGGGNWVTGGNGQMIYQAGFGNMKTVRYEMKYNLECEVTEIKNGMIIELEDSDGVVSKYNVVLPQ